MTFELTCLQLSAQAAVIAPARPERAIFDANRHAYKCLPLAIANTAGWELLCPVGVTLDWNGGSELPDLSISMDDESHPHFAKSNFRTGIVTFDTGWLFQTPPGHHLWAMGPTNDPKDGISALSGLIETDWLPYPFTMNWKMTRPGVVRFEKGEPFCFITPGNIAAVADCQPLALPITDDTATEAVFSEWTAQRRSLMERIHAGDAEANKHRADRRYFKGEESPTRHFLKLRAKPLMSPGDPSDAST